VNGTHPHHEGKDKQATLVQALAEGSINLDELSGEQL
jgi:hypothetical protein